jgi:hypothetical protein
MINFLKSLFRPAIFPIISALIIVGIILYFMVPFMARFPIFYQEDQFFFPAYSINFQTKSDQQSIVLIGGSRYKEMAVEHGAITKLLREKTNKNIAYESLSVPTLSYPEEIVLINQSRYKRGSVVLIGLDINSLVRPPATSHQEFESMRLGFTHYNDALPLFKKNNIDFNISDFEFLQNRYWLKLLATKLSFSDLISQSWYQPHFKYRRPTMRPRYSDEKITKQIRTYGNRIRRNYNGKESFSENSAMLLMLVKLAREKGYKVFFIEAPFSPAAQLINKPYMKSYAEMSKELTALTGVEIIHASNVPLNDSDFRDLVHLDVYGREKYQSSFINQLAAAIADSAPQDELQ